MRKSLLQSLPLLAATGLLLVACNSQQGEKADAAASADTSAASADAAAMPALAAMPTEAVSGEAAKKVMYDRHEAYEDMGDQMKVLMREAKAGEPDMAAVKTALGKLAEYSPQLPGWFPPGTGPDAGKTEAKANIWETPDDFMAKAKAFHEQASKMAGVTDAAAFQAGMKDLGGSCKACHDKYREED